MLCVTKQMLLAVSALSLLLVSASADGEFGNVGINDFIDDFPEDEFFFGRELLGSMSVPTGPAPTPKPPTPRPPAPTPAPPPTPRPPTNPPPEPTEAPPTGSPPTSGGLPTIVEILTGDDRFTTLVTLASEAGLVPPLEAEGPLTVFAPTNQAFIDLGLPPDTDQETIASVLLYHVVNGEVPLEDDLSVTTLNGAEVTLTVTETETKVNDADIVETIPASNGIVYVIDSLLIPPSDPAPAPTPNGGGGNNSCPDGTGCDICPDGTIADDSRVVTINVPGTGNTETAMCAEWFAGVCALSGISGQRCTNFQNRLTECCTNRRFLRTIN